MRRDSAIVDNGSMTRQARPLLVAGRFGMGRSSQKDAIENRAKILECACRLFRRYGVENVSVADVMGAANMTTGGFYRHFESKEALVREAFQHIFQDSSNVWRRIAERQYDDLHRRSGAIVEHYLQKRSADWTCPMLAFAAHVAVGEPGQSVQESYRDGCEELFAQFREHMQSGHSNQDCTSEAMVQFAAMVGAGLLVRAMGDTALVHSILGAVKSLAMTTVGEMPDSSDS